MMVDLWVDLTADEKAPSLADVLVAVMVDLLDA